MIINFNAGYNTRIMQSVALGNVNGINPSIRRL